ncbi:O-antigen ligase family protein [Mesorhizobium sp. ZC-5]|uniref:O-antigen ligase family protein n=1 Tax=Mesorhizobium sp. ZC-5 TaxID=2986066 RepID=UPI0021E7DD91|nr:O-antigen ligase family protein [Mesorhizobium sp. ZC-5]MCV3243672.1 O-antigen ligase family protein [Mesorhizobium sp. ZC-5]
MSVLNIPGNQTSGLRSRFALAIAVLLLLASAPFVAQRFPDYLPGYLIQIPAVLFAYGYAVRYDLAAYNWPERATLLLCYLVPLENTFIIKAVRKALLDSHIVLEVFRPSILLLTGIAVYLAWSGRRAAIPATLRWSFVTGLMGWLIATMFAAEPLLSVGVGIFEFLAPWLAMYVILAVADRPLAGHALRLFCAAFVLVAIAQTAAILPALPSVPLFASEFLEVKKNVPLMVAAGGNGYGNTDNLISLSVMAIPVMAGSLYLCRLNHKLPILAAILLLLFAGMLTYSRAGTVSLIVGLLALWLLRVFIFRQASLAILSLLVIVGASHTDPTSIAYFTNGVASFLAPSHTAGDQPQTRITTRSPSPAATDENRTARREPPPVRTDESGTVRRETSFPPAATADESGIARLEAWKTGAKIAAAHPLIGIGYGHYVLADKLLTAPHSMILLRLAEGGILSAVSFLLLALYAPLGLLRMLWRRERDMFAITCLVAVSAFFLKAAIFGAAFSIAGMIPWGFCVALLIATSNIKEEDV